LSKDVLRNQRDLLEQALERELYPRYRCVLQQIQKHIYSLQTELADLDRYLIDAMAPYVEHWHL